MWFINPLVDGNEIYFCEGEHNIVEKIDINTKKTSWISQIPSGNFYNFMRFFVAAKYNQKILIAPHFGDGLYLYNEINKEWKKISDVDSHVEGEPKFLSAARFKNLVILIPWRKREILIYDIESEEVQSIAGWYDKVCSSEDTRGIFTGNYCIVNDKIYVPFAEYSKLIVLDPEKVKFEIITLDGNDKGGFSGIANVGGSFYLSSTHSPTLKQFDFSGKLIKSININVNGFLNSNKPFSNIFYRCGKLWIFPDESNMILQLDFADKEDKVVGVYIDKLSDESCLINKKDSFTLYNPFAIGDDIISFMPSSKEYIYLLNTTNGECSRFKVDNGFDENLMKNVVSTGEMLKEENCASLQLLLKSII